MAGMRGKLKSKHQEQLSDPEERESQRWTGDVRRFSRFKSSFSSLLSDGDD